MQKYLLIALIGLAAGCRTTCHNSCRAKTHDGSANLEPRRGEKPPPMKAPEQALPAMIYFREARDNLWQARDHGFLSNEQYADLLEKLGGDMRQIIMEEERNHPPFQRLPMRPPPRRDDEMPPRPGE